VIGENESNLDRQKRNAKRQIQLPTSEAMSSGTLLAVAIAPVRNQCSEKIRDTKQLFVGLLVVAPATLQDTSKP
jgi:hypothetical protein